MRDGVSVDLSLLIRETVGAADIATGLFQSHPAWVQMCAIVIAECKPRGCLHEQDDVGHGFDMAYSIIQLARIDEEAALRIVAALKLLTPAT